jgi:hypothetical protein
LVHNPVGSSNPLQLVGNLQLPKHAQDVAVARDGSGFAAAGADGVLYYFDIPASAPSVPATLSPAWPWTLPDCKACRWVDISADGSRLVTIGSEEDATTGNLTGRGNVFMLSNNGNSASPIWPTTGVVFTQYGPNSVSMDAGYGSVAVADGAPPHSGGTPHGGFTVFDGADGSFRWRYSSTKACYSMAVSVSGNAAVGGSDDGNVYYFTLP